MKILHLISSGGMYGAEAVILHLSQVLNHRGDQSEVAFFENLPHPNYDLQTAAARLSIVTHPVPCQGQIDLSLPRRIRDLTRSTQADVVHAHGYKADLYTWAALRNQDVPFISTCHTWYDNSVLLRAYGAADRHVLRSFAAVVAVSHEVESRLLAARVAPDRISIVPNGIDTGAFLVHNPTPNQDANRPLVVGLVGRLSYEKGIDLFVHAAARVLEDLPDTRFHIIGDGPERLALEHLIQTLNLSGSVSLLGRKDDMPAIYPAIDLIVSASRQEGLPISLLEAMASGRAILATSVGEVPSLIRNQETGLLVPPNDIDTLVAGMRALLTSASLRQQLGTAARHRVEAEFSAEQMTERYCRIYRRVLASPLGVPA